MDYAKIEQAVRGIYQSRLKNVASACVKYFDPDAALRIAGLENATPMSFQEKLSELVHRQPYIDGFSEPKSH